MNTSLSTNAHNFQYPIILRILLFRLMNFFPYDFVMTKGKSECTNQNVEICSLICVFTFFLELIKYMLIIRRCELIYRYGVVYGLI